MTTDRSESLIALLFVVASLVSAACTVEPGSSTDASAPVTSTTAGEATASPAPSVEASATEPSPIGSSIEPSLPAPTGPDVAGTPMPEPPAASLTVEGGDPVVGELGSFSWQNGASDSPWLPGNPMHVGSGEHLRFSLAKPVGIANWQCNRQPPRASLDGSGAVGMGEGASEPITFAAPPRGTWSVNVSVWFADDIGSAAYYWLVTVD